MYTLRTIMRPAAGFNIHVQPRCFLTLFFSAVMITGAPIIYSIMSESKGSPSGQLRLAGLQLRISWQHASNFNTDEHTDPKRITNNTEALKVHSPPKCSIYVMDAAKELARLGGGKYCNISDSKLWPHSELGHGLDGLESLHHSESQHASIYWLSKAIRSSKYLATDIHSADLVFVDYHCYLIQCTAFLKSKKGVLRNLHATMTVGLARHPRFAARQGSDFVVAVPHPAFNANNGCTRFNRSFVLAAEKGLFCPDDREKAREGRSLILPYTAVVNVPGGLLPQNPSMNAQKWQLQTSTADEGLDRRPLLLFYLGSCPAREEKLQRLSSGKNLRARMVQALNGTAPDIKVSCACGACSYRMDHEEMMWQLGHARFCPVIAGDTQSSRRLSEVVLAGCIPLFLGPPFHTLPLANDIDYLSFSVFVNMTNTSGWVHEMRGKQDRKVLWLNNPSVLQLWTLDMDVPASAMLQAATFEQVVTYLRSLPEEDLLNKQQALAKERDKFLFASARDGTNTSLTNIVLRRMCNYAAWLSSQRA